MREAIAVERQSSNAWKGDYEGPRKQTVLLVEDEDMVRELMCEVLEREGYEVLACGHPAEGIEVSKRLGRQIDLLLTDVVKAGMNGREMADRIHTILPQLRVVFMSGYTEHALTQNGLVFSSRRRHTRCLSDWSSDVCSSDLDHPWLDPERILVASRRNRNGSR